MTDLRFIFRPFMKSSGYAAAVFAMLAARVEAAEPASNWTRLPDLPTARLAPGAATVDGKVYVVGGCLVRDREVFPVNAVEAFTPETGTWETRSPLPTARSDFGIAVAGHRIFVIGGTETDSRSETDVVEIYDVLADRWTTGARMPTPRSQLGAVQIGGEIYAVGGNAGHEHAFERYDPATDRWTTLPALATPRRHAGIVALGGKLYAVGGVTPDGSTPVNTVDAYDPATQCWSAAKPARLARTDFAAVAVGDAICAIGGFNRGARAAVESWRPTQDAWSVEPDLPAATHFHAAVALNGKIYVAGGTNRLPDATSAFYVLEASRAEASAASALPPKREAADSAAEGRKAGVPVVTSPPFRIGRQFDKFTVVSEANDEEALHDVADALLKHALPIGRDLECDFKPPVRIELFADQDSLDRQGMNPRMRGHYAYSGNRRIQMVSPRNPISNLSLAYADRVLIAVHEFVHLVNHEINPRMPPWLNEGVAVYVGPHAPYARVCQQRFPFERVPELRDLQHSYGKVSAADLFAFTVVDFIVAEYGLGALNRLIREPGTQEKILGLAPAEFEQRWRAYLEERYVRG